MQSEEERAEAYQKACGLMNVAEIEFGNDIQYHETNAGWVVTGATQEALTFLIENAKESGVQFRIIKGELVFYPAN